LEGYLRWRTGPKGTMDSKKKTRLRSQEWFGKSDLNGFMHRSWMKNQGYPEDLFDGRPVIGICNTWSQATPCNAHFRELAEHVRSGVLDAGADRRHQKDRRFRGQRFLLSRAPSRFPQPRPRRRIAEG